MKQESVNQNATGFSPETLKQEKFPPLHLVRQSVTETATETGSIYIPTSDPIKAPYTRQEKIKRPYGEASFETIEPSSKKLLNLSFELITDAVDLNFGMAERSNCFDEWREMLENMARKVNGFTNNHRKIIGSLISATHLRDISDFPIQTLRIFQEATNILRQPRVSKQESRRVIANLLERGMRITAPLAVGNLDEESNASLDTMMAELLKKSRNGY